MWQWVTVSFLVAVMVHIFNFSYTSLTSDRHLHIARTAAAESVEMSSHSH